MNQKNGMQFFTMRVIVSGKCCSQAARDRYGMIPRKKRMAEDELAKALKRRRQISITITGRRTGRAITIPVWFVTDERAIWLLPVSGSDTQWYRNLKKDRAIAIQAGEVRRDFRARLLKDERAVSTVIHQFREKYSPEEIKRWYTRLDVVVQIAFAPPAPPARSENRSSR